MTTKEFNVVLENTLEQIRQVMGSKSAEYARNDEKLWNFKRAAGVLGVSPEKALLGMLTKHTVSILDIIDDLDKDKLPSVELLCEKIGDELNYLILLKALVLERIYAKQRLAASEKDLETLLEETETVH